MYPFNSFFNWFSDMGRSAIALFIVSFFVIFIAFWTGVAGCWRRSPGNITATAILILLSCTCSRTITYSISLKIFLLKNVLQKLLKKWSSDLTALIDFRLTERRGHGILAWSRVLWKGTSNRWRVFSRMATSTF